MVWKVDGRRQQQKQTDQTGGCWQGCRSKMMAALAKAGGKK